MKHQWWQLPTKVTINGKACTSCIIPGKRNVTLSFAQLHAAGPHSTVHISFGSAGTSGAGLESAHDTGVAAQQRWSARMAARSIVNTEHVAAGCELTADAKAALANSTMFSAAMEKAGLSDRFEAAQAAAFREALNASVTRCAGRASGSIGAIPAEPASWKKYKLEYNQSAAEYYFTDQWVRIWTGLVNLMAEYSPGGKLAYTALHLQIGGLFHGMSVAEAAAMAAAMERRVAEEKVAAARKALDEAKAARAGL
eukprot:SAG11_NODE_52_length_19809_cov_14.064231_5_plen_254_part_00